MITYCVACRHPEYAHSRLWQSFSPSTCSEPGCNCAQTFCTCEESAEHLVEWLHRRSCPVRGHYLRAVREGDAERLPYDTSA